MRLIITRHGETKENEDGISMGHLHGTLSKIGIEQAKKVANRLKDEKIHHIFSSNLARASDTAKEIAKFHQDIPLDFIEELRERYLGNLQGCKTNPKWKLLKWDLELSKKLGIETPEEILRRSKNFLEKLLDESYGKTILLVAHNGINQALITHLLGKSWENMKDLEKQKNTAITIFEFDENKNALLKLMNCIKHLDD